MTVIKQAMPNVPRKPRPERAARSKAVVTDEQMSFLLPGATATELVIPAGISFEGYSRIGQAIARMGRAVQWWLGDWMLHGEHKFGEKYAQAVSETGYDENTLAACQYVASRFAPARRRATLTWSHHREVAALTPKEADKWLDRAEAAHWSRAQLRRELQPTKDAKEPAATDDEAFGERVQRVTAALEKVRSSTGYLSTLGTSELKAFAQALVKVGVRVGGLDE